MGNVALNTLNPGNLTVNYPNQMLYVGQTGTYSSPNGFIYAVFGSAQDGWNALVSYIQRHSGQYPTVGSLLTLFGAPKVANPANPNPGSYLANFQSATGVNPAAATGSVDPNLIARGIATAEGASSLIPGPLASPPLQGVSIQLDPSASGRARVASETLPEPSGVSSGPVLTPVGSEQPPEAASTEAPSPALKSRGPIRSALGKLFKGSKRGSEAASNQPKASATAFPSEPSGLSSSSSVSPPSFSQTDRLGKPSSPGLPQRPNQPVAAGFILSEEAMSKLTVFVEGHTDLINMLFPILKGLVDVSPISNEMKADFDTVYSRAPAVIMAGAALAQEITGQTQPALNDLASAFVGGAPVVTAPVAPVVAPVAEVAPAPAPLLVVNPTAAPGGPPTLVPNATPAPTPVPVEVATIPTPADLGPTVDASELANMAKALGLTLIGANGQPIT